MKVINEEVFKRRLDLSSYRKEIEEQCKRQKVGRD